MKEVNLYKIWETLNKLYEVMNTLSQEEDKYVDLLGHCSNYSERSFESFLDYYSFKIDENNIVIFNDDKIAYEDFTTDDFSSIPIYLLSFSNEKLKNWIKTEINLQLERQKLKKLQ